MHICKCTAQGEAPANIQLKIDYIVSTDSYVSILDDYDDEAEHENMLYHIVKVIDIDENITTTHYYATRSKTLRSAVWKPL